MGLKLHQPRDRCRSLSTVDELVDDHSSSRGAGEVAWTVRNSIALPRLENDWLLKIIMFVCMPPDTKQVPCAPLDVNVVVYAFEAIEKLTDGN